MMIPKIMSKKNNIQHSGANYVFFIVLCLMILLLQVQEVCAEKKKVSGSLSKRTELAIHRVKSTAYKPAFPVGEVNNIFAILKSDDPEWNNATLFSVWFIENLNFIGHGVVTHPNGDQSFRITKGKLKALNVHDWEGDYEGWFTGGTGKYKGIKGRWREKTVHVMSGVTTNWEV